MYWIYLIIFTCAVFVPSVIREGSFGFSLIQTQEYAILLLGVLALIIFHYREQKYKISLKEKARITQQANRMSKELTYSYSYIGEINRKLDILENVMAGFPESSSLTNKKNGIYKTIMSAIQMLNKSDDFVLRFVDESTGEVLKEFRSQDNKTISYCRKECSNNAFFFETDELIFARSMKSIDHVYACIIIRKKTRSQKVENPDILKTLAMQALFLYVIAKEKATTLKIDKTKEKVYN